MSSDVNKPGFGAKLRTDSYYQTIAGILRTLRPLATRKVMADKLNSEGLTTPSGKPWDGLKIAAYLRTHKI